MCLHPFKYGCIVNGDFFCPRPLLERGLRRFVESGQNVVVQGERRMGKTSLVCEAVRKTKGVKLLYVDLLGVRSISDFCRKVTAAVAALNRNRTFLARAADLIHRLRPTLTIDTITGSPTISVDMTAASSPDSLEDVLDMVAVLARESKAYTPILSGLTAIQMRVLRGIAQFGGKQTLSGDFLRRVGVPNAGSVRKSILRMVELDILYAYDGTYKFTNPFFSAWLLQN